MFHDLETNSATTTRVSRRISDKHGKLFNDDMITMTSNAAQSICLRNAILRGIPKAVWRNAFSAAEQVIAGDAKTLSERRDGMVQAFATWGIIPEQIATYLEIEKVDEITLDDIVTLRGVYQAIKDGDSQIDDVFEPAKGPKSTKPKKDLDKALEEKTEAKDEKSAPKEKQEKAADKSEAPEDKTSEAKKQTSQDDPDQNQKSNSKAEAETKSDDKLQVAHDRGRDAASNGLSPRAIPPEYRGDDDQAIEAKNAWKDGFEERAAEMKEG